MAEHFRPTKLVLASASPRRHALLTAAGYSVEVIPTHITESEAPFFTASECARFNARLKAVAGRRKLDPLASPTLVLGADTLVSLGSETLGKPADLDEAFRMVSRLAGHTHEVYTGVCLLYASPDPVTGRSTAEFVERTTVKFRPLDPKSIRAYLARINPLDKAGGYAAQEHGADVISGVDGSWTNVLGLPMETLTALLAKYNVLPSADLRDNHSLVATPPVFTA